MARHLIVSVGSAGRRTWIGRAVLAGLLTHGAVVGRPALADPPDPGVELSPADPTPAEVLKAGILHLRATPAAQSISVRVVDAGDHERFSRIEVRSSPGEEGAGVRLRLGRALDVEISGEAIRAASPRNPLLGFEAPLGRRPTLRDVEAVLPPIPVPHLAWLLADSIEEHDGGLPMPPLGKFSPGSVEIDAGRGERVVRGMANGAPAYIAFDQQTLAFRRLGGALGATGLRVELAARDLDTGHADHGIDMSQRTLVAHVSDLRPGPARSQPGEHLTGLGLVTPKLTPWSLADAIAEQASRPTEQGDGPLLGVLVLSRAGDEAIEDAAVLGVASLRSHKKYLDRHRLAGETSVARLFVQPVAVFDVAGFSPAAAAAVGERWALVGERVVLSTGGQPLLDRFEGGAKGVVVVFDEDQSLLGEVPLQAGVTAGDAALAEVRAIIEEVSP